MKPETEQNIEKTLKLLEGIEGAKAPDGFTQKVLARLDAQKTTPRIVPMRTIWATVAAAVILLALNVWLGTGYNMPGKQQPVANDMQQMSTVMGFGPQGFWY